MEPGLFMLPLHRRIDCCGGLSPSSTRRGVLEHVAPSRPAETDGLFVVRRSPVLQSQPMIAGIRTSLVAAVLLVSACSPEIHDNSNAACENLLGSDFNSTDVISCEAGERGCVLVACFGSAPDDVEPSCDRLTLTHIQFGYMDGCSPLGINMYSSGPCYQG